MMGGTNRFGAGIGLNSNWFIYNQKWCRLAG